MAAFAEPGKQYVIEKMSASLSLGVGDILLCVENYNDGRVSFLSKKGLIKTTLTWLRLAEL